MGGVCGVCGEGGGEGRNGNEIGTQMWVCEGCVGLCIYVHLYVCS